MKLLVIRWRYSFYLSIFFAVTLLLSSHSKKPFQDRNPKAGYYVVVAAYLADQDNYANRLIEKITGDQRAQYAYFPVKNMLFVYVAYHDQRTAAIEDMRTTRKNGDFTDAWVYVYKPEEIPEPSASTEANIESSASDEENAPPQDILNVDTPEEQAAEPYDKPEASTETIEVAEEEATTIKVDPLEDANTYKGMYPVYLWLHHGRITDPINGKVQVIDPVSGKNVFNVKGNQWEYINKPNNSNNMVQFEVDIFGYRKIIRTFDLESPINDTTNYYLEINSDSIQVEFELVRYEKGDIFTMYQVYFFSHSAIMRPESRNELDQLLTMLNENERYKIMIHGHTNGNNTVDDGLYQSETSTEFFSRKGAIEESLSSKKLSELRAETVRNYLVYKGISKGRMDLKGWGGKRPLYKKLDPQAIQNVRVEIEIMEE